MFSLLSPLVVGIVLAVIAIGLVGLIVIKRYRIAEPDEAIIVTGRKGKVVKDHAGRDFTDLSGQKVVTGGGVFVLPFVQRSFNLSLRSRRLSITTKAQTKNGITITAQAVAVIKVGGSEEMIRSAAQRFLSQQEEIESSTQEVLSGSLRGIIGGLTVTEIIADRTALASAVLQAAEDALTKQGLVVDTLQIQEIRDDQEYIANLGRPESAAVRRNAEIADTEATRSAQEAKIEAEKIILDANRELKLKEASVRVETDKAAATAAAAKPLEDAIQRQRIVEQEEITAAKEAQLKEQTLNAEVRKVADAEAYRTTTEATAAAESQVAQAKAEKAARIAAAEALAAEGEAEGKAITARGTAEAAAIAARAQALKEQSGAVLAQQMIEALPLLAKEFASAYSGIDNLTIVSADGANKLNGDMAGNMAGLSALLKDATGIDITALIQGRAVGEATGAAIGDNLGKAQGSSAKKRNNKLPTPTPTVSANEKAGLELDLQQAIFSADTAVNTWGEKASYVSAEELDNIISHVDTQLSNLDRAIAVLDSKNIPYEKIPQIHSMRESVENILEKLNSYGLDTDQVLSNYVNIESFMENK